MAGVSAMESGGSKHMGGADRFSKLPVQEQEGYRRVNQQRVTIAQEHAIPIIFAPPLSVVGGKVNGATGFALQLSCGSFIVTASHVLAEYEDRLQSGEVLDWLVGNLQPFDPLSRVAWRHTQKDIVLLGLSPDEINRLKSHCTISAPIQWPPSTPKEQQLALVAGYPKVLREVDAGAGKVGSGPYSAMLPVSNVGAGYFYCQIDQKDLISFNGGPLPDPGTFLGGLSGGPVLLVEKSYPYPVVGVISQSQDDWGLLRIASLDGIDEKDFR